MSQALDAQAEPSQPMAYQIRIEGQLDSRWSDWFEGLTITLEGSDTLITGPVIDQAALHDCSGECVTWGCLWSRSLLSNPAPPPRSGQATQMWRRSSRQPQ